MPKSKDIDKEKLRLEYLFEQGVNFIDRVIQINEEIDEQSFGPEHPDVARDLNNLALLLQATNRLEEAERVLKALEGAL